MVVADDPVEEHGALFERDGERVVPTPLARRSLASERAPRRCAECVVRVGVRTPRPRARVVRGPADGRVDATSSAGAARTVGAHDPPGPQSAMDRGRTARRGRDRGGSVRLRCACAAASSTCRVPSRRPSNRPRHRMPRTSMPFRLTHARSVGYWHANDVRWSRGSWMEPGPGTSWFNLRCEVVAARDVTPFQRVAACADFGSGVGNPLRMTESAAINPEVSIHVLPRTGWASGSRSSRVRGHRKPAWAWPKAGCGTSTASSAAACRRCSSTAPPTA